MTTPPDNTAPREIIMDCGSVPQGNGGVAVWEHWTALTRYIRADAITPQQAAQVPEIKALIEAAHELRRDMMERAQFKMDVISGQQYRIVNAGNSAWTGFDAALQALAASDEPPLGAVECI